MFGMLIAAAVAIGPTPLVVEQDGVRVEASVRSSVYLYEVSNRRSEPITRIELPYADGYNFKGCAGWECTGADGVLRAACKTPDAALKMGDKCSFSFRITSRGAVLGYVPARIQLASGRQMEIRTWGAVEKSKAQVLVVAGMLLGLAVAHVSLLRRRERRVVRAGR